MIVSLFGERVKELRLARNLMQVQLAKELGLAKQTVSNWENEYIQPSVETLWLVADYFGVSMDYLMGRDNKKYLEINGLSDKQLALVQMIIDEMIGK